VIAATTNSAALVEAFDIEGSPEYTVAAYLDSACKQKVSRGLQNQPIVLLVRLTKGSRDFSEPVQVFLRNEAKMPATRIVVKPVGAKATNVAVAPDGGGVPKAFGLFGEPVTILDGRLMPMRVVAFWVKAKREIDDEPDIYELAISITADTAVIAGTVDSSLPPSDEGYLPPSDESYTPPSEGGDSYGGGSDESVPPEDQPPSEEPPPYEHPSMDEPPPESPPPPFDFAEGV